MTKMQEDELPDDDAVEEGADFACFLRIMQWMSDCSLVAAVGTVVISIVSIRSFRELFRPPLDSSQMYLFNVWRFMMIHHPRLYIHI